MRAFLFLIEKRYTRRNLNLSGVLPVPIQEIRHPLIRHKLGLLRRAEISTKNFRELAQEVTMLLTYEATKDLPVVDHEIQGWAGEVTTQRIAGKKITIVPRTMGALGYVMHVPEEEKFLNT